jgi:hypothetical protein
VSQLVIKFDLVPGYEAIDSQNIFVCEACSTLVAKLDWLAFELDSCVDVLKERIATGIGKDMIEIYSLAHFP